MRRYLLLLMLAFSLQTMVSAIGESPVFDIPRLNAITIDGDPGDWGTCGLRVGPLLTLEKQARSPQDFDQRFRLGWNQDGLFFIGFVRDQTPCENEDDRLIGGGDAVELFVGMKREMPGFYQVQISPGADPRFPKARTNPFDLRVNADKLPPITVTAAGKKTADGYVLEALLPWTNLAINPAVGTEIGVQVWMTDCDRKGDWFRTLWYPAPYRGPAFTGNLQRVRLVDRPVLPVLTAVHGEYERFRRMQLDVYADGTLAGKTVAIRDGRHTLARATLAQVQDSRIAAHFTLPMPPIGKPYGPLTAVVPGAQAVVFDLPSDADAVRAKEMLFQAPAFQPAVFTGAAFPPCDFQNPQLIEELIGPYTLKITFYDREYRQVTTAATPGRYGAVIDIIPVQSHPLRRFRTLYRLPDGTDWWGLTDGVTFPLPAGLAIDPALLKEREGGVALLRDARHDASVPAG